MKKFINLTTGLEWLPEIKPDGFVRIESTLCEQRHWSLLVQRIDANFIFPLVRGEDVMLYDTSSRNGDLSRACWQGAPLLEYFLHRALFDIEIPIFFKGYDAGRQASRYWSELDRSAQKKLKYLRQIQDRQLTLSTCLTACVRSTSPIPRRW